MGAELRHYRDRFDSKAHESSQTVHQVVAGGAPVAAQWRLIGAGNFAGPASAGASIIAESGNYNTLGGVNAGAAITTGDKYTAFGYGALENARQTFAESTAVGYLALNDLTTGLQCNALGVEAGAKWTTARYCDAIGSYACYNTVAGSHMQYSQFFGYYAGRNASGARYSVGIGYDSLSSSASTSSNEGIYNTCVGSETGRSITTAVKCSLFGRGAGQALIDGDGNSLFGVEVMFGNAASSVGNTLAGVRAATNGSGDYNTGAGFDMFYRLGSGSNNTGLGSEVGYNANGDSDGNLYLGYQAGPTAQAEINNLGYIHNAESDTPTMSFDFANQRVGIIFDPSALTNILTIQETSATDPLADAWDVYPSNRMTKHELGESSDLLANFPNVKTYRYKRKAIVSEDEVAQAGRKIATNELRAMGVKGRDLQLMDMNNLSAFLDTAALKKQLEEHKAGLPKFTTERIGMMIDDPEVPPEILIEYGDKGDKGISMLGYIGYLHGVLRELAVEVQELKAQMG